MVPELVHSGKKKLFVDSSGNAGATLAAFGALHGAKITVYSTNNAPIEKELQIRSYGGKFILVDGGRNEVISKIKKLQK